MSAHLVVPAKLTCLAQVREFVRGHARALGFPDHDLGEIDLAVTEAVSNVVRHAYGGDESGRVEMEVAADEEAFTVVIRDTGRPMPAEVAKPDLDNPSAGGYGIYLIETVMDRVERLRGPGGNELRLTRRRPPRE